MLTGRAVRPVPSPPRWALGLAGVAGVLLLLLGGTLLGQAAASPDERSPLLRDLPLSSWHPEQISQVATPAAPSTVPAAAPSQPGASLYAAVVPTVLTSPTDSRVAAALPTLLTSPTDSRGTPIPPSLTGRAEGGSAAMGPLPPTTGAPSPTGTSVAASPVTVAAVALPPPRTATVKPAVLAAAPAFGVTAVATTKTPVPPTPTFALPSSAMPSAPPSPTPLSSVAIAAVVAPSPPPLPTVAPSATALPRDYKLGDTVAITQVLKGFAFTGHWLNSPEGVYATDWYPRSTTESCANSHRLPLAMPVAGKWRLASVAAPMGGNQYTLIGELDDGNSVGFTHVDRDVRTGRVEANTVVGFVGISGLEQFDAMGLNPSHAHTAWNDRVVPGWDGDAGNRPAREFFSQYGFQVELRDPAQGATPQTYLMRQGCGGMINPPRPVGRR
jgi:hypothetical protein